MIKKTKYQLLDEGWKSLAATWCHADTGKTCRRHTCSSTAGESNPRPSRWQATVSTTAPVHTQHCAKLPPSLRKTKEDRAARNLRASQVQKHTGCTISNQALSCGQSGLSHVARHARFHFLPNTTTPCPAVNSPTFVCLYRWALMKVN